MLSLWRNSHSLYLKTVPVKKQLTFCNVVMSQLYSHILRTAMVAKTPAELMQKPSRQCLLMPVRVDHFELTKIKRKCYRGF